MYKLTDIKIKKLIQNDFKTYLAIEIYITYKGYMRHTLDYIITYSSKTFDTINQNDLINIFEKSYQNACKGKMVDSQMDKLLNGIAQNMETNNLAIGKSLSNSISFALLQSQAIMQEVSLKSSIKQLYSIGKGYS